MYLSCKTEQPTKCCVFWKENKRDRKGHCSFNDGACRKILEACHQCEYVDKIGSEQLNNYCSVYMNPSALWKSGQCPMYVNPEEVKAKAEAEKKVNPLKASRRKAKGRSFV